MKTVKMKISGISINDPVMEPLIILKSSKGETFPVSLAGIDRQTLLKAMITRNTVYSEIVSKLLSISGVKIKKIILNRSDISRLTASVHTNGSQFEISAGAGILLCIEAGIDITVNSELFKEPSFFRNRISEKRIFEDFDRLLNGIESNQAFRTQDQLKETVQ